MKIDLNSIRSSGVVPRVHGNGFLQLDIGPQRRLHVWGHPDLPRQSVNTAIHNHRFDFNSQVIVGRVFNIVYQVETNLQRLRIDPSHTAYVPRVREGEDTVLEPVTWTVGKDAGGAEMRETARVFVDESPRINIVNVDRVYSMPGPMFHETTSDRPSATVMHKRPNSGYTDPWVLVPLGQEPDNDFRRDAFPEEGLWEIIHDVLGY